MASPDSRMYEGETAEDAAKRAEIYNEATKRGIDTSRKGYRELSGNTG